VFALHDILFGDLDDGGGASASAWRTIGFDVDGLDTTATSTNVCQLYSGSPKSSQVDGVAGIDNSFGANIMPLIETVFGRDASAVLDASLENGAASTLLAIDGLGADTNASPLSARIYVGAPFATAPKWDGSDTFAIDSTSFGDGGSALLTFPQSYVANGTFVAAPPSAVGSIWIGVEEGSRFVFEVTHLQFEMHPLADGSGATNGTLAGILPTDGSWPSEPRLRGGSRHRFALAGRTTRS
jgi:hypothetical protein